MGIFTLKKLKKPLLVRIHLREGVGRAESIYKYNMKFSQQIVDISNAFPVVVFRALFPPGCLLVCSARYWEPSGGPDNC